MNLNRILNKVPQQRVATNSLDEQLQAMNEIVYKCGLILVGQYIEIAYGDNSIIKQNLIDEIEQQQDSTEPCYVQFLIAEHLARHFGLQKAAEHFHNFALQKV